MGRNYSVEQVRSETATMMALWETYPQLRLEGTSPTQYRTDAQRLDELVLNKARLLLEMKAQNDEMNRLMDSLHQSNVRLRIGAKSYFGFDSVEYSQAGGKRLSQFKSARRSPKP